MTIREKLQIARRRAGVATLIGWPMCAGGMVLGATVDRACLLLFIPGFILFAGGLAYMFLAIRCPRCKGALGYAVSYPRKGFFGISEKIRFCQFCGVSLDSQLPEQEGPTDQTT